MSFVLRGLHPTLLMGMVMGGRIAETLGSASMVSEGGSIFATGILMRMG